MKSISVGIMSGSPGPDPPPQFVPGIVKHGISRNVSEHNGLVKITLGWEPVIILNNTRIG